MTSRDAANYVIDPGRALPLYAYRADAYSLDMDRIFRNDWVFVATSDQVAEPGQYVAVDVGGQPIIVLRNQSGDLAALSNLCAHRGTLLVEGSGVEKRFQCPYHAWTYADDGRLLAVPHTDRSDIDRDTHCLPTYRAEAWHGLVFVSMNPDVAPLRERFAHLEAGVADAGLDELHHWTGERSAEEWQANWKLVMANAMESYHLFKVHPETLEPYTPTAGAYYRLGAPEGTATGGSQTKRDDYTLLSLPPNLVAVITDGNLLWQAVVPLAHDRSRIVAGGAYPHPSPSTLSGVSKWVGSTAARVAESVVPDFLPEDKAICERGQRAASGDFDPGALVPMERVVVDFHEYLADRLG